MAVGLKLVFTPLTTWTPSDYHTLDFPTIGTALSAPDSSVNGFASSFGGGDFAVLYATSDPASMTWDELSPAQERQSTLVVTMRAQGIDQIGLAVYAIYGETEYEIGSATLVDTDVGTPKNVALDWSEVPDGVIRNRIIKTLGGVTYVPGGPGSPGDPGHPAIPARCYNETTSVCFTDYDYARMFADGWRYVNAPLGEYGWPPIYAWYPPPGNSVNLAPYAFENCSPRTVRTCTPYQPAVPPTAAVPAAPSQTIIDYNFGWNAGGHSIAVMQGSGYFRFQVPASTVGAFVGLNDFPAASQGYRDMEHSFYFTHGVFRIYERGALVTPNGTYPPNTFDNETLFRIQRVEGQVEYYRNDVLVHTSDVESVGAASLDVSLYSGGDYIFNPEVVLLSGAHVALMPLAGTRDVMEMLPLTGSSRFAQGSSGELVPLTSFAGEGSSASVESSMLPITGFAFTDDPEVTPAYAVSNSVMMFMTGVGSMLTGQIGGATSAMTALGGLSSEGTYAESVGSMQPLGGSSSAYEGQGNATFIAFGLAQFSVAAEATDTVSMIGAGTMVPVFTLTAYTTASMVGAGTMVPVFTLTSELTTSMIAQGMGVPILLLADPLYEAWVANAETGGFTRYENYPFNSFAKIDGKYYGARSSGIFELAGDTDDGDPIQWMVDLGKLDFGSSLLKRVTHAYVGASSTGALFMRVTVDEKDYLYRARDGSEQMQTQRFDLGRGLRSNFYDFEIYNADGDDVELRSVEFVAVPLSRRI